jgi:hypothetical protein
MVFARVAFLMNVCETHTEHNLSYGQVRFANRRKKEPRPLFLEACLLSQNRKPLLGDTL